MKKMTSYAATVAGILALAGPAMAAGEPIRIGMVTTLSGPSASIGRDDVDGLNLALDHIGHTIAGQPVELVIEDDAASPELGRQKAEKLARDPKIEIVAGFVWTNVLLAARKPVLDAGKILFSVNAGPSELAGKQCTPNFLSIRSQTDVAPMESGNLLNQIGVKKVFVLAPNYSAAKDVIAGMKLTYKGEIAGQALTKWGEDPQLDFSAELANVKASGADAIYAFFPGRPGAAFVRQFDQSDLVGKVKLVTIWTLDQLSLPQLQAANVKSILGSVTVQFWAQDLDFPANKKFVSAFKEKYGRIPSDYAAQPYDMILAIKAAIEHAGDPHDVKKIAAELHKADYESIRGPFRYSVNGMPVNPYYQQKVVALPDGTWTLATVSKVSDGIEDPHLKDCPLAH